MKRNKFLAFLNNMLLKLAANLWPIWWTVVPFLFFYLTHLAKYSMLTQNNPLNMNIMKKKKFNPQQWLNTAQNNNNSTNSRAGFSPLGRCPNGGGGLASLVQGRWPEYSGTEG